MKRILVVLSALLLLASPAWALLEQDSELFVLQNAAAATGNGSPLFTAGYNTAAVQLTLTDATVTWEGVVSGTFVAIPCVNKTTGTSATTATATGVYVCDVAGLGAFQARVSTYGSGTISAIGRASTSVTSSSSDVRVTNLHVGEDETNNVQRVESQWEYEDVAASQTDQVIGGTGAVGDLVSGVYCAMSAASVGTVSITDGAGSAFVLFQAQAAATAVQTQPLNWVSTSGAWKLTTGTNTTCRVSGRFS